MLTGGNSGGCRNTRNVCLQGYEHARGVYTLPDFSFFDGVWVDGVRHGVGVSFPPPDKDAQVNITAYMHGRKVRPTLTLTLDSRGTLAWESSYSRHLTELQRASGVSG